MFIPSVKYSYSRAMLPKRISKGRQKIDIVKMKNESNLQVTFSKRRAGLFKKASELCTLTGSEIAVIVFSPGEKAYSFGSPSVSEIIARFDSRTPHLVHPPDLIVEAHRRANVLQLNRELGLLEYQLDNEKKRGEKLKRLKDYQIGNWWEAPFDELRLEQLIQLSLALEELQKKVNHQAHMILSNNPIVFPNFTGKCSGYGTNSSPISILRASSSSAFVPYETKPFPVFAGPSIDQSGISIKDGPLFDMRANGSGPSLPFDPNANGFGGADHMHVHPYGFGFFNKGSGDGSF